MLLTTFGEMLLQLGWIEWQSWIEYIFLTKQVGGTGNTNYVQPTVGATTQPAMVTPTPANPPTYTPSAQQQVSSAEFQVNFNTLVSCGDVDFLRSWREAVQYYLFIFWLAYCYFFLCWALYQALLVTIVSDCIHDIKPI